MGSLKEFVMPNGSHSYKFIEELGDERNYGTGSRAEMYQCDAGQTFRDECAVGFGSVSIGSHS